MEMCANEDMLPGYSLPSMAPEGHDLSCHYKKRKRWRKGVGLPFYRVAAMLLVSCCAFRRKRTNSAITLTRKMRATSQQPDEEVQPLLEQTVQPHQARAVRMEWRAEINTSKGLKQGLLAPGSWPPLFPSPVRSGYAALPRKVGTTSRGKVPLTGVLWKSQSWRQCWS